MYYDIVNSGERIKELRAARRMTRQQLAEQIGLSVDALRKIEAGVNGAKIDTLISIAELFHITLDYLVCGCERKAEVDDLLVGLKEKEVQFIRNMVLNAVDNMKLLTEKKSRIAFLMMQSGFFYKDLEQVGVLLLVQKSVGYCRRCVVSVILCSGSEKRTVEY